MKLIFLWLFMSLSIFATKKNENHYQTFKKDTFDLPSSLLLIKKTIDEELAKETLNMDNIALIFNLHGKIARVDNFAANIKTRAIEYFSNYNTCECNQPDCLNYSCDGSFLGRARDAWCEPDTEEEACFVFSCCIPCYALQFLVGWCMPCGYNNHCCITEINNEAEKIKDIKNYLSSLKNLYANPHWDQGNLGNNNETSA